MSEFKPTGVALVTGASGTLGPGLCQVLRREGYRVAACVRSIDKLNQMAEAYLKISGERFDQDGAFIADLADLERLPSLIEQVRQRLGPISLLVNNAVYSEGQIALPQIDIEFLRRMSDVNVHAPVLLMQAAMPDLIATKGCVVNLSSVAVDFLWPGATMYGAGKAALEYITRCLAAEYAEQGVRLNAIRLGSVPGYFTVLEAIRKLPLAQARQLWHDVVEQQFWQQENMSRYRRVGRAQDVGELIAFLASPKAAFMTGSVLTLDGGLLCQMSPPAERTRAAPLLKTWLAQHAPHIQIAELEE